MHQSFVEFRSPDENRTLNGTAAIHVKAVASANGGIPATVVATGARANVQTAHTATEYVELSRSFRSDGTGDPPKACHRPSTTRR